MSGRSFHSVFMVASCAGAALGCYLVSLRVASERAALEEVETEIVLAQRDIRLLQTEIGTRGRLAQLERWNVKVLALSAPSADQFLEGGFALARMVAPQRKIEIDAPVVLAAAPADTDVQAEEGTPEQSGEAAKSAKDLLYTASLKSDVRASSDVSLKQAAAKPAATSPSKPSAGAATKPAQAPVKAGDAKAKPVKAEKSAAMTAKKTAVAKPKAKPIDPLAPLATSTPPKKVASATSKDAARKQ